MTTRYESFVERVGYQPLLRTRSDGLFVDMELIWQALNEQPDFTSLMEYLFPDADERAFIIEVDFDNDGEPWWNDRQTRFVNVEES